ncbi:MAG: transketolase family protein [Candidatus Methanofastidiosia archaeon]
MKCNVRDFYGKALVELGEEDADIVALDADLSHSTKTAMFGAKFPERFFNMGISEQNMISTSAGLASFGKKPFVSTFCAFVPGRTFDQIKMCVAYPKMNIKLVSTHGGISVGKDGASHHAIEDIAMMRALPNMRIFVPSDPLATYKTIKHIYSINGPCYVRLFRDSVEPLYNEKDNFDPGKAYVLEEGDDITIIGCGLLTHSVLKARKILEKHGIFARIVDMQVLKPFDKKVILNSAKRCGKILTVEDHSIYGGMGSLISEYLSRVYPTKVERIGVRGFAESGSADELYAKYGLSPKSIVNKAKEMIL